MQPDLAKACIHGSHGTDLALATLGYSHEDAWGLAI